MKRVLSDLALFSGIPAFAEPLYVGRPNIGNRDKLRERMEEILDRRWLTNNGHSVQEFERRMADFLGVAHCIPVCNGTVALEIAIRATGLSGEVIVPSFTFVATPHALQWLGITPVFCDIDRTTHCLSPAAVEHIITPRTTGIIGVHVWGRPCAIDELTELAARKGLTLLFDAAHAFGCSYQGRMIGSFGQAEVFSFHATKFVNSFEGGAIATNDDDLARKIRLMKNFGFSGYDQVIEVGTNGKMSEISAAMGVTSLESVGEFVEANKRNYLQYAEQLAETPGLKMARYDAPERHNFQYIVIEIDEPLCGLTRDQLVRVLHADNIMARRYFHPGCHQMEPYRSLFPRSGETLPETERLTMRVVTLPTGTAIGQTEIATVCEIIRCAVRNAKAVAEKCACEAES